jgi:hypothetical protein
VLRAKAYAPVVRVIAIGMAVLLVAVSRASGAGDQTQSVRVSQKAIGVSLPRGVSGDVRPQMACPSVSACVATFGTANLLVLGEHRGKWTREATVAGVGVRALACPSIGSCVGTGWISGEPKAVVTQSGRSWRASAVQLPPGDPSPSAAVLPSVSCGSAGDCTAVGWYQVFKPGEVESHALVVGQRAGIWGAGFDAQLPPDAATASDANGLGPGGVASVVSCPSAGNCAIGGTYFNSFAGPWPRGFLNRSEGWVATERAGQWGRAVSVQLPGSKDSLGDPSKSGTSPFFGFTGLSCPSAGNCTAVGGYAITGEQEGGLILEQRNGVWLPGIRAPLPRGGIAPSAPNSWIDPLGPVSCAAPNDCAAIGSYVKHESPNRYHGLLLTERSGKWSASGLVLPRNTKAPGGVFLNQVTCPSRGNCVAIGFYASHGKTNGLIDIERKGKWQRAMKAALPANADKTSRRHAFLDSVSCPSTNRCTIVGSYDNRAGKPQSLILSLRIR